jgi:Family of unknown function (DUF6576)
MIDFIILISGIIIGLGISLLFRFILKRKIIFLTKPVSDKLASLQDEIIYLEKVVMILNEDIDVLYNEEVNDNLSKNIHKINIDDIIDKINKEGIGSLSDEQKSFLDKYSK